MTTIGDRALLARRARNRGKLDEQIQHLGRHRR